MIIGLLIHMVLAGQLLYIFHPMETIEDCRAAKVLMDKQPNVFESACVGAVIDAKVKK